MTRTALWSAEKLTAASVASAHDETRVNAFHVESAIDASDRADLVDYRGSGYDRGHMAPSGDMPDDDAQYESFSLGNMVPQAPDNNRHLWQGIEIATRAMAKTQGEVYVVTGPLFIGPRMLLNDRVSIPTHLWKAIYAPSRGAAAYVSANRPGAGYAIVSIAELARLTGVDPFPAVPGTIKANAINLPPPRPSGRKLKSGPVTLADLGIDAKTDASGLATQIAATDIDVAAPASSASHATGRARERHHPATDTVGTATPHGVAYMVDTALRVISALLRLIGTIGH